MNNFGKVILSVLVLSLYFLLGIATSQDEDFADFAIWNSSSECTVTMMRLSYVDGGENQTNEFPINGEALPGDTLQTIQSMLNYRTFSYQCSCPNDSTYTLVIDISSLANLKDMGVLDVACY